MKTSPSLQAAPLRNRSWAIGCCLLALAWSVSCSAALPEPYNLIYGSIEMDGHFVTAAETNVVVEARRLPTGATIARYVMGSQASASNFYALKIRLESPAPDDIMSAAETGTTLYITVLRGSMVKNQLEYDMGNRGAVKRLDFGNIDTDGDGLPDGWEQAYLFGLQFGANDDPDGDGVTNRDEYTLGTHPFRPDAQHPADVDQDWRISIPELSAYYSAWKRGNAWPIAPTNIPLEYVTRATFLWERGETYHLTLDPDGAIMGTAPLWWAAGVAPTNRPRPDLGPPPGDLPLTIVTLARPSYQPGTELTLTNRVTVQGNLRTYALEHRPPPGWTVVSVAGGVLDTTNNLAKWGPYFDRANRDLVLTLRPPADARGLYPLTGGGSYDGFRVPMQGLVTLSDLASLPSQIVFHPSEAPGGWVLNAPPMQAYAVEVSTDLLHWVPVITNWTDAQGQLDLPPATGVTPPVRFYRARLMP